MTNFSGAALGLQLVGCAASAPSSPNTRRWRYAIDAPAFVKVLNAWICLNGADAVRMRDGLCSASSGNPNIPSCIGDVAFRWLLTAKGENEPSRGRCALPPASQPSSARPPTGARGRNWALPRPVEPVLA